MKNNPIISILIAFTLIMVFTTCSKKDDPPPVDPATVVKIADNVVVLNASVLAGMSALDTTTFQLNFTSWPSGMAAPKVGEIMVGGVSASTPYGVLRKVTAVNAVGAGYTCSTEAAQLDEVILQGKIDMQHSKLPPSSVKSIQLESGVKINPAKRAELLGFDLSFEKELGSNAKAFGSLYLEVGFNFLLDVTLDPPHVDFKASIEVDQSSSIGVRAIGDWSGKTMQLAEIEFMPWTIMVGPVPVVFVPKAALKLKAEAGNVTAKVETFASESFNRELGIKSVLYPLKAPDWTLINQWEPAPTYDIAWPSLEGNADFVIKCGPELSIKLYGQAGPYFDLLLKSSLGATAIGTNYNLDLCLGLEANAGVNVNLLGFYEFDYSKTLFDKDIKCWNLNNTPIPNDIHITSPANGSIAIIGKTIPLYVTANGHPLDGIKLYIDNVLKTTLTQSPYTWNWIVSETEGQHTLKVEATIGGVPMSHSVVVNTRLASWSEPVMTGFKADEIIQSLSFYDGKNGIAVGFGDPYFGNSWGFLLHTSDGGITWDRRTEVPNDFGGFTDVLMVGANQGYACGDEVGMYQTSDGGASWKQMIDQYGNYIMGSIIKSTSDATLVKASGFDIGVSTDGKYFLESSNAQISIDPPIYVGTANPKIVDIAFGIGGTGFFAGTSVGESWIYKTTDHGMSWNKVTTPGLTGFLASSIEVRENSLVWVSGVNQNKESEIYWSVNGGSSWQKAQLPGYFAGAYYDLVSIKDLSFIDVNTGYAVGAFGTKLTGSSLLQTIDGGKTWNAVAMDIKYPFYEMKKLFTLDKYHVFTAGYSNPDFNKPNNRQAALFKFGID